MGKGSLSRNQKYLNLTLNHEQLKLLTPDIDGKVYLTIGELRSQENGFTHYVGLDKLRQEPKEDAIRRNFGTPSEQFRSEE